MKDYRIVLVLSIAVLLSCGGGQTNTPNISADSVTTIVVLSAQDSLQHILNQLLADTFEFAKFPCQDKYGNVAIVWYEDSIVRLVRLHSAPNNEGIDDVTPDYLFFDETGTLFSTKVDYGSSVLSVDSVFRWTSSGFVQSPIYGRGVPGEIVDPILYDYKFQSLRFLEIYSSCGFKFHFDLLQYDTEFACEPVQHVEAYIEADRSSEYFTLKPGQLPFHYIGSKKDSDGVLWIEIRIPTPDPVDNELLYIPAHEFFAHVNYGEH